MGQLAKHIAENSSRGFGANTEKIPKKNARLITRSKKVSMVKDEGRMSDDKELVAKGEKEKKEDRMREKKINDEEGKGKEEKKYKKREKMRKKRRQK